MAKQSDPADEASALQIDRRPLGDTVVVPVLPEAIDQRRRSVPVDGTHELEVFGLLVDFKERLDVGIGPLPQQEARRPNLEGDPGGANGPPSWSFPAETAPGPWDPDLAPGCERLSGRSAGLAPLAPPRAPRERRVPPACRRSPAPASRDSGRPRYA